MNFEDIEAFVAQLGCGLEEGQEQQALVSATQSPTLMAAGLSAHIRPANKVNLLQHVTRLGNELPSLGRRTFWKNVKAAMAD